ncbi:hypothetical protein D3C79_953140 [compost metagenome]
MRSATPSRLAVWARSICLSWLMTISWVTMTPLGKPVLPDENWMIAISAGWAWAGNG